MRTIQDRPVSISARVKRRMGKRLFMVFKWAGMFTASIVHPLEGAPLRGLRWAAYYAVLPTLVFPVALHLLPCGLACFLAG